MSRWQLSGRTPLRSSPSRCYQNDLLWVRQLPGRLLSYGYGNGYPLPQALIAFPLALALAQAQAQAGSGLGVDVAGRLR